MIAASNHLLFSSFPRWCCLSARRSALIIVRFLPTIFGEWLVHRERWNPNQPAKIRIFFFIFFNLMTMEMIFGNTSLHWKAELFFVARNCFQACLSAVARTLEPTSTLLKLSPWQWSMKLIWKISCYYFLFSFIYLSCSCITSEEKGEHHWINLVWRFN